MVNWQKLIQRTSVGQKRQRPRRQLRLDVERLEERSLLSGAPAQHVLLLSVDGLHNADVADPALAPFLTNTLQLENAGITYTNAHTTSPSDSFPGTLSYLTGAGPGTTGVFYDDSYSRTLLPPGSNSNATPGTEVTYFEAIDKNSALISGGGNFDASSIDPTKLPIDPTTNQVVYPNQFLQVNTIFDVAHQAGLYTAFSDKHPAYQIANGNNPSAINDFYGPEINSTTALLDNTTGHTVDANALLAADPFVDLSNYTLVDASTDPAGASDPNLINDTTTNLLLTEKYDDLKVQAILNEINGLPSHTFFGSDHSQVPAIFGMNFQAVSVAEKYATGGIPLLPNGQEAPSTILEAAMQHTDASIGAITAALHSAGIWNSTLLVLTAKHGQAPRVGSAGLMHDDTLPNLLSSAGAPVAQATQDDVSLLWLQNQSRTDAAVTALQQFKASGTIDVYFQGVEQTLPASQIIDKILSGQGLVQAGLGNPATDSTTPDIVVTLNPGYIWVGNVLSKHKNAEHGGFSDDDTHIALILSGGAIKAKFQGTTQTAPVKTEQIAVTVLDALGLNPKDLTGVQKEHTKALPGTGIKGSKGKGHKKTQTRLDRTAESPLVASADKDQLGQRSDATVAAINQEAGRSSLTTVGRVGGTYFVLGRQTPAAVGKEELPLSLKGKSGAPLASRHVARVVHKGDSVLATDELFRTGL
jgi:arylsulfatase A-like enzyme